MDHDCLIITINTLVDVKLTLFIILSFVVGNQLNGINLRIKLNIH